jgi:hypothetical protein
MEFKEKNMKEKGEGNNEEEEKASSWYLESERDMFKSSERFETVIPEATNAVIWEIYRIFKSQIWDKRMLTEGNTQSGWWDRKSMVMGLTGPQNQEWPCWNNRPAAIYLKPKPSTNMITDLCGITDLLWYGKHLCTRTCSLCWESTSRGFLHMAVHLCTCKAKFITPLLGSDNHIHHMLLTLKSRILTGSIW